MEKTKLVSVVIPTTLLDYISNIGLPIHNLNCKLIIQNAYDYCTELPQEELDRKMADTASKYYKIFLYKRETKLIHVRVKELMKQYQASNLILLYTLIYLADHEDVLYITEENRFNV